MNLSCSIGTMADDLAARIHRAGEAFIAAEGAQVDHPALWRPRERVGPAAGRELREGTVADDLTPGAYRLGETGAAERAYMALFRARRPRESMSLACSSGAMADDLAAVVHRLGLTEAAAEGAQVNHPALW